MAELVLAVVVNELQSSWNEQISSMDLINLLYDAISEPANLKNKNGEYISVSPTVASYIVNRKPGGNPNAQIRKHAYDQAVVNTIDDYFERHVVRKLRKGDEENLIHRLLTVINSDKKTISDSKKLELVGLGKKNTLASFLARVYQQSLQPKNVLPAGAKVYSDDEKEEAKHHPLPTGHVPDHVGKKEKRYTDALMEVYAEAENITSMKEQDLKQYPSYKAHFTRQRNDYFAAEAVRRGTRDFYGDDEEEYFTILLKEIFDGVIDTWEKNFPSGFDRLREVLDAAMHAHVDQCWLARDTVWVGNSQKKGACHVLVNENQLDGWVK